MATWSTLGAYPQHRAPSFSHTRAICSCLPGELFRPRPTVGAFEIVIELAEEPINNRCNNAQCDPAGNPWVGAMDDHEKARSGQLWRFSADGRSTVLLKGIRIANTLARELRCKRFCLADSSIGDIYVFDYDAKNTEIRNRQVFFSRGFAPGVPDGSAIDERGCL